MRLIKMLGVFFSIFFLVSCKSSSPEPVDTYTLGSVMPIGESEIRNMPPKVERIPNCTGSQSVTTKHPSVTSLTQYAVEWSVGGQAGIGVTVGGGVFPISIDLAGTLDGHYAPSIQQSMEKTVAWDLSAEPNTIVEHTIVWREVWQPGQIEVKFANQEVQTIDVIYRVDVDSDIIDQQATDCDGNPLTWNPPLVATPTTLAINTDVPQPVSVTDTSSETPAPQPTTVMPVANTTVPSPSPVPSVSNQNFSDWQAPSGHATYIEYRRCVDQPDANFPEFTSNYAGYIFLNPQNAQLQNGVYTWCFHARTILDTETLESQYYPNYAAAGYGDLESIAVYFCATPTEGICDGKVLMPIGNSVSVDGVCTLSPVVGSQNGVAINRERTIQVTLPSTMTQSPTIVVGPYPVGNPAYIACP